MLARRTRSAGLASTSSAGGDMGLPVVVEQLLVDVVTDGFTMYCCGPQSAPHALVAAYEWANYVDLVTIGDFDRVTTARVPIGAGWTSSLPRSWSGPTRVRRSGRCEPCWAWCIRRYRVRLFTASRALYAPQALGRCGGVPEVVIRFVPGSART